MGAVVVFLTAASAVSAVPGAARSGEPPDFAPCPGGTGSVFVGAQPDIPDVDARTVEVGAASDCPPMDVTARIGGFTARHRFNAFPEGAEAFSFDPCGGGEGSDLPDATVEVTGRSGSVTVGGTFRLGRDTTKPDVKKIQSSPPPGSKVKRGQKVTFSEGDAIARETRSGATWQTGVQSIQLVAPDRLIKDARARSNRPQPCDKKQWSLGIPAAQYRVPESAKGAIRICVLAVDFAGNENGDTCATYYVGEVWTGTFRQDVNPCRSLGTPFVSEGQVDVVVNRNGSVTGSGTASATEVGGSPESGCYTGISPGGGQFPIPISGERDKDGFHLSAAGVPMDLSVAGKRAEGSTQFGGSTVTMDLTCKTCDGKVG